MKLNLILIFFPIYYSEMNIIVQTRDNLNIVGQGLKISYGMQKVNFSSSYLLEETESPELKRTR